MNDKIITLTGFMGCGKTFVSKILARELGYQLVDSDAEIEKRQGKPIKCIMEEVGESGFRQIETQVLCDVLSQEFLVLSAGGGAVIFNAQMLLEKSTVIFLDTPFDKCYDRIKNDVLRPLVHGKTKDEVFALYQKRYDVYAKNCHFAFKNEDSAQTAKKIKEFLQNR